MSNLSKLNLALRGIMETGIVLGLGFWGYHIGNTTTNKILFCIFAPVIGFGFWGLVDFHQFGRFSEGLRLIQELVISGFVAIAIYMAGAHVLGWTLGILSVVYHALVYLNDERLLKTKE